MEPVSEMTMGEGAVDAIVLGVGGGQKNVVELFVSHYFLLRPVARRGGSPGSPVRTKAAQ